MTTPAEDLAAALHDHHERIDQMLGNVASSSGDDRRAVFWWLRRFLAAHEAAEQVFLHPPRASDVGDEDAGTSRLLEESTTADLIARLEEIDLDSDEFDRLLTDLRRSIGKHARAEELQELPQIVEAVTASRDRVDAAGPGPRGRPGVSPQRSAGRTGAGRTRACSSRRTSSSEPCVSSADV